jgi:cell division protein FtsZ
MGILTIGVVTRPFNFEGTQRANVASEGIIRLKERADCVIVIRNESLLGMCDANVSIEKAFRMVDEVLFQSVNGISEVITSTGNINLDFNDVKATMSDGGHGWISVGYGTGENRAVDAALAATKSSLYDFTLDRARKILFNITYSDMSLAEVGQAGDTIRGVADPTAQIIFGLATDRAMGSDVKITLIATGFGDGGGGRADEETAVSEEVEPAPVLDDQTQPDPDGRRRRTLPWAR